MIDCLLTVHSLELEAQRLLANAGVKDVLDVKITPTIDSGDAVLHIKTSAKVAWVTVRVPDLAMSLSDWSERYLRPALYHIAEAELNASLP